MKRFSNIDIMKLISIYFVASIHFFLYSGYYEDVSISVLGVFQTVLRSIVYCGVPLFIIATGYLQYQKRPCKKYFYSISKFLVLYIVACIVRMFYLYFTNGEITIVLMIKQILNFEFVNYSWYINMFIGLFLFIPFLNIILDTLSKKRFIYFLIGFSFFIGVPCYVNMIVHAVLQSPTTNAIPVWWYNLYPILYYFIGAGIRKYNIQLTVKKSMLFIITGCLLNLIVCMLALYFNQTIWIASDYSSISTILMSIVLATSILNSKKIKELRLPKIIIYASNATLATLLCYGYVDELIYQYLDININNRLLWFLFVTGIIWMIGNILGIIMNFFSNWLYEKGRNMFVNFNSNSVTDCDG